MDASPDFPRQSRVPVFNLPGIVTASIAAIVGIHALRALLPDLWDLRVLIDLAFIPARWTAALDPGRADEIVRAAVSAGGDPEVAAAQRQFARAILSEASAGSWGHP